MLVAVSNRGPLVMPGIAGDDWMFSLGHPSPAQLPGSFPSYPLRQQPASSPHSSQAASAPGACDASNAAQARSSLGSGEGTPRAGRVCFANTLPLGGAGSAGEGGSPGTRSAEDIDEAGREPRSANSLVSGWGDASSAAPPSRGSPTPACGRGGDAGPARPRVTFLNRLPGAPASSSGSTDAPSPPQETELVDAWHGSGGLSRREQFRRARARGAAASGGGAAACAGAPQQGTSAMASPEERVRLWVNLAGPASPSSAEATESSSAHGDRSSSPGGSHELCSTVAAGDANAGSEQGAGRESGSCSSRNSSKGSDRVALHPWPALMPTTTPVPSPAASAPAQQLVAAQDAETPVLDQAGVHAASAQQVAANQHQEVHAAVEDALAAALDSASRTPASVSPVQRSTQRVRWQDTAAAGEELSRLAQASPPAHSETVEQALASSGVLQHNSGTAAPMSGCDGIDVASTVVSAMSRPGSEFGGQPGTSGEPKQALPPSAPAEAVQGGQAAVASAGKGSRPAQRSGSGSSVRASPHVAVHADSTALPQHSPPMDAPSPAASSAAAAADPCQQASPARAFSQQHSSHHQDQTLVGSGSPGAASVLRAGQGSEGRPCSEQAPGVEPDQAEAEAEAGVVTPVRQSAQALIARFSAAPPGPASPLRFARSLSAALTGAHTIPCVPLHVSFHLYIKDWGRCICHKGVFRISMQ